MPILAVKNLHVNAGRKEIIKGVSFSIVKGKTHFLMGPNGAGKSTLGFALMGHPNCVITKGSVFFLKKNITRMAPESKSKVGLFMAFQHSPEFEGIRLYSFLRAVLVQNTRKAPDAALFYEKLEKDLTSLGIEREFARRYLNFGFSGGEKKKNEILQLLELRPKFAILDEIDSGLDADSLRKSARIIARLKKTESLSLLVITHNSRLAKFLKPDFVHVLIDGRIVTTGGKELITYIDKYGYKDFA